MSKSTTPKKRRVYKLEPQGLLDLTSPRVMAHRDAEVQVVQPAGCPRNGTMGMVYVQAIDGNFIGLVSKSSLTKTNRMTIVRDRAAEARDARSRGLVRS